MSDYNMNSMMTNREMALAVIALPFQAAGRFLRSMLVQTSRMTSLNALHQMSDAELTERGLTRPQAAMLILRSQF